MARTRIAPFLAFVLIAAVITVAIAADDKAEQAKAEPAKATKIRTIEGITEYRLDNGLQVLLYPDRSKPTVTVNLTVFVGSRHEGYGETVSKGCSWSRPPPR